MIDWQAPHRVEQQYLTALRKIGRFFIAQISGVSDLTQFNRAIELLTNSTELSEFANLTAKRFITQINLDQGRTWREAARASAKGRTLYDALMREMQGATGGVVNRHIVENASLIKSIPQDVAKKVNAKIAELSFQGLRASEIAERLAPLTTQYTKSRIELISRTEVSKAQTALALSRMELVSVNWYTWKANKDQRLRHSHRIMDGVLINRAVPPAPEELDNMKSEGHYHAGNIYNCRCFPSPLLDINHVQWPHKVHYKRQIVTMTKAQFEKIM